ncbi:MAG TPA: response regulator [Thermodesulfobacteriota bacterium]|nr:response regulator [Thermodesulfobacteriota bacterium]
MKSTRKQLPDDFQKSRLLPAHESIQILLADDDDELREILEKYLSRTGRALRSCKDGQEALEALKSTSFDLVITDLMMPEIDGIQLLREVKRLHPESMVIIMTGYASLDTAIQAIRQGAYDYISKPFGLEELEVVVRNACEKISLMRENRRLLLELKEAVDKTGNLRINGDQHWAELLNLCARMTQHRNLSDVELILNQMNPIPPDYVFKKTDSPAKTLDILERLVQFKKDGFIDDSEFRLLKEKLLRKLGDE